MSHQGLTGCEPTLTRFTFSSITCVAASSAARKKINYLYIWEGITANSHHPLQQLQLGSRMAGANVPEAAIGTGGRSDRCDSAVDVRCSYRHIGTMTSPQH